MLSSNAGRLNTASSSKNVDALPNNSSPGKSILLELEAASLAFALGNCGLGGELESRRAAARISAGEHEAARGIDSAAPGKFKAAASPRSASAATSPSHFHLANYNFRLSKLVHCTILFSGGSLFSVRWNEDIKNQILKKIAEWRASPTEFGYLESGAEKSRRRRQPTRRRAVKENEEEV
nr:hypothetical protein Iba_chr07bCG5480 [Ipomoea batatas]